MESSATKPPRVFISYSHDSPEHADRVLIFTNKLREDGIDAILDQFEEFGPAEGWTRWMTKHIRDADFVLMICTEPYYRRVMGDEEPGTGQGVRWEGNLIFQYINDADTKNRRFIPVLFDNGQKAHIPDPIRPFQYYHLKGPADYDLLYRHLTNQPSVSRAPLGKLKTLPTKERRQDFFCGTQATPEPPHNIPREGPVKFVGREQTLMDIAQKLKSRGPTAITSVAGMGGVGKTELAIRYARRNLADYPGGVCWLRARETEIASQILTFVLKRFDLQPPDTLKDGADRVEYCWTHWPQDGQVLLILDDAIHWDNLDPYLPNSDRFHILVTTRQTFTGVQPIDLNVLPPGDALDLLKSLAGEARCEAQQADAENLCVWLGYLPLALELVGRYLETKPDMTLAKILTDLEARGLSHRSTFGTEGPMTAKRGLAAAFELSWETLDNSARELGCLLSLYALAPIPWESVQACFPDWDEEKLETARDSGLLAAHLLQRKGDNRYQFHQLVREFFQEKLKTWPQAKQLIQAFVKYLIAIAKQVPDKPTLDILKKIIPLVPHLEELATRLNTELDDESLISPFLSLQRIFEVQSLFSDAEKWNKAGTQACIQRLGPEHSNVTASLNNLAGLYYEQGLYADAEYLLKQTLKLLRKQLGSAHPVVANNLNNLAILYNSQGQYAEAEPILKQALEILRNQLGQEHPNVAISLNNLAAIYCNLERYTEAEPLYQQALEIWLKQLGSEHPNVANSLNNLALLYKKQGRYAEANPLYQQALEIRRKQLGSEHPDVATSLNNLAELYRSQGQYADAEPLLKQALEISEMKLGDQHPITLTIRENLEALKVELGKPPGGQAGG